MGKKPLVLEIRQENGVAKETLRIDEKERAKILEEFGPLPPELWPHIDHLITEDETPVDNIGSEKQQRFLAQLYDWAGAGRPFVVLANVALYFSVHEDPIVPDVMVSFDVTLPEDVWQKSKRSYLIWEFGKPPNIVIEIVSNKTRNGDGLKKDKYAQIGVAYYVIYDPTRQLSDTVLRVLELRGENYTELASPWMPGVGLGLTLWEGQFEDKTGVWLRWCDEAGNLILTGAERAGRLEAQLRALAIEPEV